MPPPIRAKLFTREDAENVQNHNEIMGFRCSRPGEPWAEYLEQWIKRNEPEGDDVLKAITEHGTQVWLFFSEDDELIGYGSLGTTDWKWPQPAGPKQTLSIIPALAVDLDFQGKPDGPREDRYAHQIMSFLIEKARLHKTPALVLFVDNDNQKAQQFYQRIGFEFLSRKSSGDYRKMALNLSD